MVTYLQTSLGLAGGNIVTDTSNILTVTGTAITKVNRQAAL